MENMKEIKSKVFVIQGIKIVEEDIKCENKMEMERNEEENFLPKEKINLCSFTKEKFQLSKECDGQKTGIRIRDCISSSSKEAEKSAKHIEGDTSENLRKSAINEGVSLLVRCGEKDDLSTNHRVLPSGRSRLKENSRQKRKRESSHMPGLFETERCGKTNYSILLGVQEKIPEALDLSNSDMDFSDASLDEFCCSEEAFFSDDLLNSGSDVSSEEEQINCMEGVDVHVGTEQDIWKPIINFDDPPHDAPLLKTFDFTVPGNTGFQWDPNLPKPKEPIDWFQLFFTSELLQHIADETNRHARVTIAQKNITSRSVWKGIHDVTVEELKAFIGLVINIGMIRLPELRDYWSNNPIKRIPFFSRVISKKRFFQIFWTLHVEKLATIEERKLGYKVAYFVDYINKQSKKYFVPFENVAIVKSPVKFRGNSEHMSCDPKKPPKCAIKCLTLVDLKTGFAYYTLPYYGSKTADYLPRPDLPPTVRTTVHMSDYLRNNTSGKGYHVFTDNYFSSPTLSSKLLEMKFHHTGTIFQNRVQCPEMIKKLKEMKYHEVTAYHLDDKMMVVNWKDNRVISVITTKYKKGNEKITRSLRGKAAAFLKGIKQNGLHKAQKKIMGNKVSEIDDGERIVEGSLEIIKKPLAICEYTKYMGEIDKVNNKCSVYNFERKSSKLWRKIFFWMLEVAIVNSFTLFKEEIQDLKRMEKRQLYFRDRLVCQLVENVRNQSIGPLMGRPNAIKQSPMRSTNRLDGRFHSLKKADGKRRNDCKVCSKRSQGRKKTTLYCETCYDEPFLCPGACFNKYHTEANIYIY